MTKGKLFVLVLILFIAAAAWGAWYGLRRPGHDAFRADVIAQLSAGDSTPQFERAIDPYIFEFPRDYGPHPSFQTEWWYYTGNLQDKGGRHFGYQLTIFRRALGTEKLQGPSKWRSNQVYFGHFAVTDVQEERFYSFERFSRGALGLAGAQADPYRVWLEDWQIFKDGKQYVLLAEEDTIALKLRLTLNKPTVFQGDQGLSQKSQDEGNASYYYAQTRLSSEGVIQVGSEALEVSGSSWLDREWSTSAFKRGESGWDWFAIQLEDQREVMLYHIRYEAGGISPYSSGSYIDAAGHKTHLRHGDYTIHVMDTWQSPHTGSVFPSAWKISIPAYNLDLLVTPYINDQEHRHSFNYWEGAVEVQSSTVNGQGYVELTGY
jgi:predicted secreted hydrolase